MEPWYYIIVLPGSNTIDGVQQAFAPGIGQWPNYYHVDRDCMALIGQRITRLEKISDDPETWSFDSEPVEPVEPVEPEPEPEPTEPTEPPEQNG